MSKTERTTTRIVTVIALIVFRCAGRGLVIYAPAELAHASVAIDGRVVGQLSEARHHYKWVGWKKLRGEVSAPPRQDAIGKLGDVAEGDHELRIEKAGYEPIVRRIQYGGKRVEVEIADAEVKKRIASSNE